MVTKRSRSDGLFEKINLIVFKILLLSFKLYIFKFKVKIKFSLDFEICAYLIFEFLISLLIFNFAFNK